MSVLDDNKVDHSRFIIKSLAAVFGGTILIIIGAAPFGVEIRGLSIAFVASLFLLMVGGLVIPMLFNFLKMQLKEGNEKIEEIRSTFLTQASIDLRLRELAWEFDGLCHKQIQFQKKYCTNYSTRAEEALHQLSGPVEVSKSDFWSAHNLAKELGFEVHEKIGDYL